MAVKFKCKNIILRLTIAIYLIFQNQICLTDMYHTTITGIYTRYLDPNETQDRGKGGRFQNHSKHFITWYYNTMKVFSGGFV